MSSICELLNFPADGPKLPKSLLLSLWRQFPLANTSTHMCYNDSEASDAPENDRVG